MPIYYVSGIPFSDELYHHGIKGQKWGLRRYQNEDGTLTPLGKVHYGVEKLKEHAAKKLQEREQTHFPKNPRKMSDAELKERVSRLQMENQYRQLLRDNSRPVSRGKQVVTEIMENSARTLVSGLVSRFNTKLSNSLQKAYEDQRREEEERPNEQEYKKSLGYKYDKYAKKELPKNYKKYTDEDWKKFDTIYERREKIRDYENMRKPNNGGGGSKKGNKGNKGNKGGN